MQARTTRWNRWMLGVFAALAVWTPLTRAEEAVPSKLDSSEARDYMGNWKVSMDMNGRQIEFMLHVVDLAGKVGATIDSAQAPEPVAVEDISIDERGHIVLKYLAKFGQQEFKMTVTAEVAPEGLEGMFIEDSGLFKAPFKAVSAQGDDAEIRESRSRSRRAAANSARLRFGEDKVNVNFSPLTTGSEDFKRLEAIKDGEVFEYVGGRATKLMTDVDLKFAQAVVKKENAAPDYPGVYSLWLRKSGEGWELIFNNEADVWGTMYNSDADAATVKLEAGKSAEPSETLKVALEQTEHGGVMRIIWGDRQWSAPFEVEGFTAQPAATTAAAPAQAPAQAPSAETKSN